MYKTEYYILYNKTRDTYLGWDNEYTDIVDRKYPYQASIFPEREDVVGFVERSIEYDSYIDKSDDEVIALKVTFNAKIDYEFLKVSKKK